MDPYIFDNTWTYGMALGTCQTCTVQAWCLQTVDPARNYYDGVVGGHVWRDGRPVDKFTDTSEPILALYMNTRLPPSQRGRPMDEKKIRDCMVGKLAWTRLTIHERVEVAIRCYEQNVPQDLAVKITRLADTFVRDVYTNPNKYRKNTNK